MAYAAGPFLDVGNCVTSGSGADLSRGLGLNQRPSRYEELRRSNFFRHIKDRNISRAVCVPWRALTAIYACSLLPLAVPRHGLPQNGDRRIVTPNFLQPLVSIDYIVESSASPTSRLSDHGDP